MKFNVSELQNQTIPSPKKDVKRIIMDWFKNNNCDVGHTMTQKHLLQNVVMKLNPKQKECLEDAVNELESENLIKIKDDGITLALTEKGVDYIY